MQSLKSQPITDRLHHSIKERAAALIDRGIDPQVAVVMVGTDPESATYVSIKEKRAKEDGIILSLYHLAADAPFVEIEQTLQFLATDPDMHGIVLQLPLPKRFTASEVDRLIALIPPSKDVDGLAGGWKRRSYASAHTATLQEYQADPLPPMVLAVLSLLDHYQVPLEGKRIVLVGNGRLVGAPLHAFFQLLGLSDQVVDEHTENILAITKEADILITGTGERGLVTYQWVKEGATVIDCSGDIHTGSVEQVAGALSPAQGGIGPLTVAWLLHNVINAAEVHHA